MHEQLDYDVPVIDEHLLEIVRDFLVARHHIAMELVTSLRGTGFGYTHVLDFLGVLDGKHADEGVIHVPIIEGVATPHKGVALIGEELVSFRQ